MVKQKWIFSQAPQAEGGSTLNVAAMSTFHYAIDHNDNSPPANLSALEEYQTYKNRILAAEKPFTITYRPTWLAQVYEGVGTGYSAKRGWIDTNDPAVYHYGVKWSIQPSLEGVAGTVWGRLFCYTTYYLAFKNTK